MQNEKKIVVFFWKIQTKTLKTLNILFGKKRRIYLYISYGYTLNNLFKKELILFKFYITNNKRENHSVLTSNIEYLVKIGKWEN